MAISIHAHTADEKLPNPVSTLKLSHYQATKLKKLIIELANEIPGTAIAEQVTAAREFAVKFGKVSPEFSTMMDAINDTTVDALYVEALPSFSGETAPTLYRTTALVLACSLGEPFQYELHNGEKVNSTLVPVAGSLENNISSVGEYSGHTDDAFIPQPYKASYISLLGEMNDAKAPTGYAQIDDVINLLTENEVEALKNNWFQFRLPLSSDGLSVKSDWSPSQPILYTTDDGLFAVQNPAHGIKISADANTVQAESAFKSFKKAVEQVMQWFVIEESTYLVLKNDRGLHARRPISTVAGTRRVYRTYWHSDLDKVRSATGCVGNVFDLQVLLTHLQRNNSVHCSG